tara:strand:- start:1782 stop:2708 length:927 start_codon:yes stop_codon:yes gene_type:complete
MGKEIKNILIIGGTGFIGSHLVNKCSSLGWKVISASLSLPVKKKRNKKVKYHKVDLTNFSSIKKKFNMPFNYIVNVAGYINHSNSKKDYNKIMKEHFVSVKNIIKVIPRKNLEKFVQIGSSDEYGLGKAPQSEKTKLSPKSTYSKAKAKTANFLKKMYLKEKYPYAIARLFLTYGPGQKKNRFISQIINGSIKDKNFPTTSGEQIRDFCYIDDTVSAILLILRDKKAVGQVFNVATGIPVKIKTVINLITKIVGKGTPQFNKRGLREGENEILYANIKKIKKILNWKPKINLQKGLKKTIKAFKKNDN